MNGSCTGISRGLTALSLGQNFLDIYLNQTLTPLTYLMIFIKLASINDCLCIRALDYGLTGDKLRLLSLVSGFLGIQTIIQNQDLPPFLTIFANFMQQIYPSIFEEELEGNP